MLQKLAYLESLGQGSKDVPSHVCVIACVVLLLMILVDCKFITSTPIKGKQKVVADTLVLLTAEVEVREGRLIEFACIFCKGLCVVGLGEGLFPQCGKFYISFRQATDELLKEEGDIEEHVVSHDWPLRLLKHLHNTGEAQLPLVAVLNLGKLLMCQVLSLFELAVIRNFRVVSKET
jgi:hypothetical protein